MTAEIDPQLEDALRRETHWSKPTPGLWKKAMDAQRESRERSQERWGGFLSTRISGRWAAVLVVGAVGIVSLAVLVSRPLNEPLVTLKNGAMIESPAQIRTGLNTFDAEWSDRQFDAIVDDPYLFELLEASGPPLQMQNAFNPNGAAGGGGAAPAAPDAMRPSRRGDVQSTPAQSTAGAAARSDPPPADARHVIRKATIELIATDVRAVFLRAALIVNEAGGEFIQTSSLTGEDENAKADLTLRVAASRLSAVLNQLRDLGVVHTESIGGDDVSAQMVDLEARLRNERRVETELLELLESRDADPLEDILRLRDQINRVRGQIEWYETQRQQLSRLVSLATVLVIIRTPDASEKPEKPDEEETLGAHLKDKLSSSWRSGATFLVDTLGGIVALLIGGMIWWVLLIVALLGARSYFRRRLELGLV